MAYLPCKCLNEIVLNKKFLNGLRKTQFTCEFNELDHSDHSVLTFYSESWCKGWFKESLQRVTLGLFHLYAVKNLQWRVVNKQKSISLIFWFNNWYLIFKKISLLILLGFKFNSTIGKGELDINGHSPTFWWRDFSILFTMGKFNEIFELLHILRIICDLDKYSRNNRHQYSEIICL